MNGNLVREKEQSLARMKEVVEDIKKLNEQKRQLEEELETVKHDATKEAIQNRIWKLMCKTNEYIRIWDGLRCHVDMIEKLLKEQNGEDDLNGNPYERKGKVFGKDEGSS